MAFREAIQPFLLANDSVPPEKTIRLGMGCAWIGQRGDPQAQQQFRAALEKAYDLGIRYYDTSAQYGGSEFRVGQWLRTVPREKVFLATKSPIPEALTPAEAAFFVRQALRDSLERLGVSQIDLFQIHDVERLDQVLGPDGVLEALMEAKQAGLIRYCGLATRFHDLLETAADNGNFDTILTYLDYTLLNQSAGWLIERATEKGVGVVCGSPLSFGLLTGQDPRRVANTSGELREKRGQAIKLYDYCQARGLSLLALALQYPMRHSGIAVTLTGPASPDEIAAAVSAARTKVEESVWEELDRRFHVTLPGDGPHGF